MPSTAHTIAVLGAGIQGCCLALSLTHRGYAVDLVDRLPHPISATSAHTEGKIHLGFVYARDTQRRTHRLMARGALAFSSTLHEIANIEPHQYARGWRFHYAVAQDSQLSDVEVEAHFENVEATIQATRQAHGGSYLGRSLDRSFRRLKASEWRRHFAPSTVRAVFETEEEAVDTHRLAVLLRQAVTQHPRIRFRGNTRVVSATIESEHQVRVALEQDGEITNRSYAAAANCLWCGRLSLDATLGLRPPRPWVFRFKAIARLDEGPALRFQAPSTTLVVGPYGDLVNYGDGRIYLSWYPHFKLAETRELDGSRLNAALKDVDRQRLARDGVKAMARYLPEASRLLESKHDFAVNGGIIFSWGSTDIDDPASGLHERWRIGPQRHGPYVTIDTGKYTMAPLFALEATRLLEEILD